MKQCCHCKKSLPCASQIEIFKHLDRESQQRISDLAIQKEFKKGELLCSPEKPSGLFVISKGKVKVYELSSSGKEKLLRVLGKGEFVGEEALFSDTETYTFAEALTDLCVCLIQRKDFLDLLMEYPSISLKLLEEFNRRIVSTSHRAVSDHAGSVLNRLVKYLCNLSEVQESLRVVIPMSMKELAAHLDTTPETLSRRMKYLEQEGLIVREGKTVVIGDKRQLSACME